MTHHSGIARLCCVPRSRAGSRQQHSACCWVSSAKVRCCTEGLARHRLTGPSSPLHAVHAGRPGFSHGGNFIGRARRTEIGVWQGKDRAAVVVPAVQSFETFPRLRRSKQVRWWLIKNRHALLKNPIQDDFIGRKPLTLRRCSSGGLPLGARDVAAEGIKIFNGLRSFAFGSQRKSETGRGNPWEAVIGGPLLRYQPGPI